MLPTMRTFAPLLLVLCACGTLSNGSESTLKPSMVSPDFKDLDAPKQNPFAQPATKVEVTKVGIAEYDKFFKQAAIVNGTVILADAVLKNTDTFIAATKKNVGGGKPLAPAELAQVKKEQQRVLALGELIKDVPDTSGKLLTTGEGLMKGAEKTFTGPNALKLPGVIKGLGESMNDLKSSATKAPALATHVEKTSKGLADLAP